MSVLSVPRIFFGGSVSWDPNTCNNNDQWETYDFANAELNWDWLADNSPVTQENFQTEFPKWAQTLKEYTSGGTPPSWKQTPAEWNYYGGNDVTFHSTGADPFYTVVTGGQLALGGAIDRVDGLVQSKTAVGIRGDSYPWAPTGNPTKARMVDVNPGCFWSTQVYLKDFVIANLAGSSEPRPTYLEGPAVAESRIHLRWMNVQRNLGSYPDVEIAGGAAVVGQICLPTSTLKITMPSEGSALLSALETGLGNSGVQGVMVRFCAYMTRYFSASSFAGTHGYAEQYARLAQLWAEALASGTQPVQNPAMSNLVGTVGLWNEGELQTMPGGRYLWPVGKLQPSNAGAAVPLGPAAAEIQKDATTGQEFLSLDLGNCIPEIDSSGAKADFGDLQIKLKGNATPIGTLTANQYGQDAYGDSAGIVDLKLPASISKSDVESGTIEIEAGSTPLLSERDDKLSVQTDQRGVYIDQKGCATIELQVHQNGVAPTDPVDILVVQYLPDPPVPKGAGSWVLGSANPVVHFDNGQGETTLNLQVSDNGKASITVYAVDGPGFPNIVFFPYLAGTTAPTPPPQIVPVFTDKSVPSITTAFFSCVRVLPFDNSLPIQLALLWARSKSKDLAWKFVYTRVLYLYVMIYPVMKYYAKLDLGDQSVVDARIGQIVTLIDESMLNNTLYMPVTRELSAGKRAVLQMYAVLEESGFSLDKLEVPPGFPTSLD